MSGPNPAGGAPFGDGQMGGRRKTRRSGMSVKALKRALKKAGLKTTGKKAALTKRAKKAHLMRGGAVEEVDENGITKYKSTNTGMVYDTRAEAERMDTPPSTTTSAGRRRPRKGRRGGFDY